MTGAQSDREFDPWVRPGERRETDSFELSLTPTCSIRHTLSHILPPLNKIQLNVSPNSRTWAGSGV